jgi:hypothetical protein
MEALFGDPEYLNFMFTDDIDTERDAQTDILATILSETESTKGLVAAKAFFQLAIAYAIGYGTNVDIDAMLNAVVESAKREYLPAQAVAMSWFQAHNKEATVAMEVQIDWLFEATAWGSYIASTLLRRLDEAGFKDARLQFHKSGGFNQYFYDKHPPAFINSADFLSSVTVDQYPENSDELLGLASAAAIYGNSMLMARTPELKVNPNFTNQWGESLVVLACKGGHLDVLEVLSSDHAVFLRH